MADDGIVEFVRRLTGPAADAAATDRELLARFLDDRDGRPRDGSRRGAGDGDRAFETLVRRHERLVRSAVARVLADPNDIDDALQATFLVLVRRARRVDWRAELGPWLYGVAHRVAVRLRARSRQRPGPLGTPDPAAPVPQPDLSWREACDILHAELDRLPDRYRLPLLLCYLEGKTRDEAAAALGVSAGVVKGRVRRGCDLLGRRLARRGVSLSAGLLGAAAAPPVGASDPARVAAVLKAATGSAPPRVTELVREVTRTVTPTMLIPLGLVVAAGLVAATLAIAPGQPAPTPAPRAAPTGDALPPGAVARIGTGRFRVGEPYPAALTPDGRHLLVGGSVLDANTGFEVGRVPDQLPDGGLVESVMASADGGTAALLVSRWDGKTRSRVVVLWDVATRTAGRTIAVNWNTLPEPFVKEHKLAHHGNMAAVGPGGRGLLFRDNLRNLVLWTDLDAAPKPVALGKTAGGGWYDDADFTPDGKFVLDVGPRVRVWDAATGKLIREFDGPKDATIRWAVSPDGTQLAVISGKEPPAEPANQETTYRVSVWDLTKGTETRELTARLTARAVKSSETFRLLFTPDGKTVVVIDDDRAAATRPVRRWRAADGQALPDWSLPQPGGDGNNPFISPDGKTLYYVTRGGVRTFDLNTGAEQSPADLRTGGEYPVGLTADDRQLVTRRGRDRLAVWDLETGRFVREEKLPALEKVFDTHFSPDARLIAVDTIAGPKNDRDTVVYDRAAGRDLFRLRTERCGTFGPDGKHLFTLTADYKTVNVREAETGKLVRAVPSSGNDNFFFSPDGKTFSQPWGMNTRAHDTTTGELLFDGKAFLPEHLKPTELRRVPGQGAKPYDNVFAYALGPGARRFAVTAVRYWDGEDRPPQDRVIVFDTAGKKRLWEANPQTGRWFGYYGSAAAFSPDGSTLAVGGRRTLLLFDAETGKQLRRYDGHRGTVEYLRFTRDGKRLVSADWDGTVWVWDATR
jgi:RNA polymerase sigma factor (sigma-70 family)